MKIVDRKTFLSMPANTLFSKYEPCCFYMLSIKGEKAGDNDFYTNTIADSIDSSSSGDFIDILVEAQKTGCSIDMDFNTECRDGLYDDNQLFAVWEKEDIINLIKRLNECLRSV